MKIIEHFSTSGCLSDLFTFKELISSPTGTEIWRSTYGPTDFPVGYELVIGTTFNIVIKQATFAKGGQYSCELVNAKVENPVSVIILGICTFVCLHFLVTMKFSEYCSLSDTVYCTSQIVCNILKAFWYE